MGAGAVALMVLCCAGPTLVAAGVLGSVGAFLGNPLVIAGGLLLAAAAVLIVIRRRSDHAACCPPRTAPRPGPLAGTRSSHQVSAKTEHAEPAATQAPHPDHDPQRRVPTDPPRTARRGRAWWLAAGGAIAAVVAVLALAGTVGGTRKTAGDTSRGAVALTSRGGSAVGDTAPTFAVATTTGSTFSLPAGKPAVVFFMAGWCSSCVAPARTLAGIDAELGDRVAILAVSADPTDSTASLRRFATNADARYGFAHDSDGTLATAFGVHSLDTTIIVDAAGKIVFRAAVPTDRSTLRDALTKAGLV